jgi:hypothetical protein
MHRIDLSGGVVLERGCVYIARLQERLSLKGPDRPRQSQELDRAGRCLRPPADRSRRIFRRRGRGL